MRQPLPQAGLERDIPALGPRVPAETLHRFWQMLAHSQGQLLNAARLAAGLGVSGHTVRSPKVYVRDSGLVHALLGLSGREPLLGHPIVGPSWEGFVVENLLAAAPAGAKGWFYRTSAGAEIDLLLEVGPGKLWAVEVKRSLSRPHPSKGFHLACADVKATRRLVVYPGTERYRIDPATEITPLSALLGGGFQ